MSSDSKSDPPLPDNAVQPVSRAEWRTWLEENHGREAGVWVVWYKRGTGRPRVEYADAVEEALCFGWIDSRAASLDDERSMQWFSPRKPNSGWSASNRERVDRLIRDGRMTLAGLTKIEAAKANGAWSRLRAAEALELPDDLVAAIAAHPGAAEHFGAFPPSTKRMILEWIGNARKPETRRRRVEETARLAAENVRAR